MQTCSICNALSPDSAAVCSNCNADLKENSETAIVLKRFRANQRVKNVRLVVSYDCCPACRHAEGTYQKDEVPTLPVPGCSHSLGCRCFYEPMLNDIYP